MKYLINILICIITLQCYSQQERPKNLPKYDNRILHYGFTLGFNSMDFRIHQSSNFISTDSINVIESNRLVGFNISIVSSLRLGEYFDLRFEPGLSFGQRNLDYSYYDTGRNSMQKRTMKLESTFIDFPFIIKYKSKRINNYRPYIIGGTNFALDLASQKEIKEEEKPKVRLQPFDIYYEFGFGIDYYLTYFKLSTEIKFAIGIMNILRKDDTRYTSAIEKMNSNVLSISFHFE